MYARMVTFGGGEGEAIRGAAANIKERAAEGPPPGVDAKGLLVLTDADGGRMVVISLFETMEALRAADAVLSEMTPGDNVGKRASVDVYEVAAQMGA